MPATKASANYKNPSAFLAPAIGNLDGGYGADSISGGPGDDSLYDGPLRDSAVDTLEGGYGNDFLITRNRPAARDFVSCSPGIQDQAEVDRKDLVRGGCERVERH